jgi:hypothetical protein
MKEIKVFLKLVFLLLFCQLANAQNGSGGQISGNLSANSNFFIKDAKIGAINTPQYEHELFGADAWLNLNYSNWGFDIGLRFDVYNNSFLPDPKNSYTDEGIGRWYVKKKIQALEISAGYLYDQIGSGIIFRAYEERPLFIDNALKGVRLTYSLSEDWKIKAFTGRQKNAFEVYQSIIKGGSIEGYVSGGEESNWSIAPGFGVVGRTQSKESIDQLYSTIGTYTPQDTVSIKYNSYAFSLYNTLSVGKFGWYIEAAYKTDEVFFDNYAEKHNYNGTISEGKFVRSPGTVIYSSLSYGTKGFGINVEGKRTENFTFRANPFVQLNRGMLNFLPPMTRINSYRLTARYAAATQELGEQAFQADINYNPNKKLSFNLNLSNITTLENDLLYREVYLSGKFKYKRKWHLLAGVQIQNYNQEIYEIKPDVPILETITPFFDFTYKLSRKKALRFEGQYMMIGDDAKKGGKQDYGDWLFGLAEYTIAPNWTFTVSDMFNIAPGVNSPENDKGDKDAIHYPRFDIYYTHKANRFSLSYVKQVEGIVCSGGICRLEPAFSGVKFTVNSSF